MLRGMNVKRRLEKIGKGDRNFDAIGGREIIGDLVMNSHGP
jgi:hypothetical protein